MRASLALWHFGLAVLICQQHSALAHLPAQQRAAATQPATTQPSATQPELSFFGLPAGGDDKRVVYAIDWTGALNSERDFIRAELIASIRHLGNAREFSILFVTDGRPFELHIAGRSGIVAGTPGNVKSAEEWVRALLLKFAGPPDPGLALRRAFGLLGRDGGVIFLFTDGSYAKSLRKLIAALNAEGKVRVNVVTLSRPEDQDIERELRRIASDNGGKYESYVMPHYIRSDRP